ncbi:MAG: DUF6515 family protein [Ferruginibacter sp.]
MRTPKIFLSTFLALCTLFSFIPTSSEAQRHKRHKTVIVVKRPAHKVVVRRAHVRYAAMPRWGAVVAVRPFNTIFITGRRGIGYHYTNGIFYQQRNNAYVVVRPSRGIRIRVIPAGFRLINVGPRRYYYYYGTYYVKAANDYVVIDPPKGAVVDALPDGYEIKTIDGNEYYYLDGVYYAEVDAPEFSDGVGYEVVEF